jgi:hypothetical protein
VRGLSGRKMHAEIGARKLGRLRAVRTACRPGPFREPGFQRVRIKVLHLVEEQRIGSHQSKRNAAHKTDDRQNRLVQRGAFAAGTKFPRRDGSTRRYARGMLDGRKIKTRAREQAGAEQGETFQHVFQGRIQPEIAREAKGSDEFEDEKELEARGGIEPPIKVLQTYALPLGDRADCLWQERIITLEARGNVWKIPMRMIC